MSTVLAVEGLTVEFETTDGPLRAVDGLSFDITAGETVAVVGESGSGKSTAALSLLRLIPEPPGRVAGGTVRLDGRDLLALPEKELRAVRGGEIGMIFQDPMMALNPVFTVERQIGEMLRAHRRLAGAKVREQVVELLDHVGIPDPAVRARQYPHNLSGGMRQRVMIAMALACRPRLLIADEPTTALDVTIQAQVLELIGRLKQELGMAVLLITHDLGVVAETAHRVIVMYGGRKVEEGTVREVFRDPRHPYTRGLLRAIRRESDETGMLWEIPGAPLARASSEPGCSFAPRCDLAQSACRSTSPSLRSFGEGRQVRCLVAERALS